MIWEDPTFVVYTRVCTGELEMAPRARPFHGGGSYCVGFFRKGKDPRFVGKRGDYLSSLLMMASYEG